MAVRLGFVGPVLVNEQTRIMLDARFPVAFVDEDSVELMSRIVSCRENPAAAAAP